jgi:hypothetical protein
MIRTNLALPTFLGILLVAAAGTASANEPKKVEKTEAVKEKFCVYAGGCSRSIRLRGTYESLDQAAKAAEKCRKDKLRFVTVRTGAHERDYFGRGATQYKVYVQGCKKKGWQLHATVASDKKAQEMVDRLKKENIQVEIVGHYEKK